MKVGIVNKRNKFVLEGFGHKNYEIYNFSLSTDELSVLKIFHSAFSTPARYVMELYRRLYIINNYMSAGGFFVFNPLYEIHPFLVGVVFDEIDKINGSERFTIFSDRNNHPIGYYFPASLDIVDARYLTLLSTVDSRIDRELLNRFFFSPADEVVITSLSLFTSRHNDFYYDSDYHNIYRWTADSSVKILSKKLGVEDDSIEKIFPDCCIDDMRMIRDSVPFTAIMPYHAGDVLFFGIATKYTDTYVNRVVVNKVYVDIINDISSYLIPITIDSPPPFRDGKDISEGEHFYEIISEVPNDSFYYYCRPLRKYSISRFHLIDHFAFALGASFVREDELISKTKPETKLFKPHVDSGNFRILLHFGGGWPLKVYPIDLQDRLINLLSEKGYNVTILSDSAKKNDDYHYSKFDNLSQLRNLLESNHLLIGMDSFPCHYAAHVIGLPTICLFANTQPANSDATLSRQYRFLENGLTCRPCNASEKCPLNKKKDCENFTSPERVVDVVREMLDNIYCN